MSDTVSHDLQGSSRSSDSVPAARTSLNTCLVVTATAPLEDACDALGPRQDHIRSTTINVLNRGIRSAQ